VESVQLAISKKNSQNVIALLLMVVSRDK